MNATIKRLNLFLFNANMQKYWLALGLILGMIAQYTFKQPKPILNFRAFIEAANYLNDKFHLGLGNPGNILIGLLFLTISFVIFCRFINSSAWRYNAENQNQNDFTGLVSKQTIAIMVASLISCVIVSIQLVKHRDSSQLFWIWLAIIAISIAIFWINDRNNWIHLNLSVPLLDTVWILITFTFAIVVGSFLLNELPAGWISDEGGFWEAARGIALKESSPGFFDAYVYSFPAASSIFQALVLRLVGITVWGWRFSSVLPAAMSVIPLYLLSRELFDRRTAIVASFMMIANPFFISFARLGYNNSQALLPITLSIYFLVAGIRRNSSFYLWLAGLTAGIGFYTYIAAWLSLFTALLVMIAIPILTDVKFRQILAPFGLLVAGWLMIVLPLLLLYGINSGKMIESSMLNPKYIEVVFGGGHADIMDGPSIYIVLLIRGIIRTIVGLYDPIGSKKFFVAYGLAGSGSSLFLGAGLAMAMSKFKKLEFITLTTWFGVGLFSLGAISILPPMPTHLVGIIPIMALLSSIGAVAFLDAMIPYYQTSARAHFAKTIIISTLLTVITITGLFQYFSMLRNKYVPSMSEYASWMGRHIEEPVNLIFIEVEPIEHTIKNESDLKMIEHQIITTTRSDLENNPEQMQTWGSFVAFIGPGSNEFSNWMANQIPNSHVQPALTPTRKTRGQIISNLDINNVIDTTLIYGLKELWDSPVRYIIIITGAGILILLAVKNKTRQRDQKAL